MNKFDQGWKQSNPGAVATCPKCGKKYNAEEHALSRRDNSPICPDCGTREALEDLQNNK